VSKILLISGREVNPFDMSEDDIDIMDIAHSLSMQCRFAGHIPAFYSVAEHSVVAVRLYAEALQVAPDELRGQHAYWSRSILLHDADEAYLQDLVRPVKERSDMVSYVRAGERLHTKLMSKFDIASPNSTRVKHFDNMAYEYERNYIRSGRQRGLPPEQARELFLGMWYLVRPSMFG
jgi:uncharacterized protein